MKRLLAFLLLVSLFSFPRICVGAENWKKMMTVPSVELINSCGITVSMGGTVLQNSQSFAIPVTIVNEMGEDIVFGLSYQELNGHFVENAIECSGNISAGETIHCDFDLNRRVLEEAGVSSLNQIASLKMEVICHLMDTGCMVIPGTITLSAPLLGLRLREAAPFPYADVVEPQVLFETEDLSLRAIGLSMDGNRLGLCLENRSDGYISANLECIEVNGWLLSYGYRIDANPGAFDLSALYFAQDVPDYAGLASLSFDIVLYAGDTYADLATSMENNTTVTDDPVRVSLTVAHPAEVPEPEGWILLEEQNGLQILHHNDLHAFRGDTVLSLLFINTTDQTVGTDCLADPLAGEFVDDVLTINGQPWRTDGFLFGGGRIPPGVKAPATLLITYEMMSAAGIKRDDIKTFDFDLTLFPDCRSTDCLTIPVHIELQ